MGSDSSIVLIVFDRLKPGALVVRDVFILDNDSIFEVDFLNSVLLGTVIFETEAFGDGVSRIFFGSGSSEANGSSKGVVLSKSSDGNSKLLISVADFAG